MPGISSIEGRKLERLFRTGGGYTRRYGEGVLRTTNAASSEAAAAKAEVGRKSLAARRADSIPASGTNSEAVPAYAGAAFFVSPSTAAVLLDRFLLPDLSAYFIHKPLPASSWLSKSSSSASSASTYCSYFRW